jgi:prolyl-tRNA synthetase
MRRSELFIKTRRQAPADEEARNAQLLIRAGYIHKEMAGVYSYLPLGKLVLDKIISIIRQEMDAIGSQELLMSTLQSKELWEKSGRWHDEVVDIWFKTRLHKGKDFHQGPELGLSNTHEEAITAMLRNFVSSYKDLPVFIYHFQTKFRNEPRAKSGLLRCREFIMKDLYSFVRNQAEHEAFYSKVQAAYHKIFDRLGLGQDTYLTYASGGIFTSDFSHEFQTLSDVGEDTIYLHPSKKIAINKEIYSDQTLSRLNIAKDELVEKKAIEVGNIFSLGTRFSEALGLKFTDEDGRQRPVVMGSYGIGPGRVMGTIVERMADEKGLVWPADIAPSEVYLISLGENSAVIETAEKIYKQLTNGGLGVIYDDRASSAGEKFADADLMGIPVRVVLSDKTIINNHCEVKIRTSDDLQMVPIENLEKTINQLLVRS